MGCSAVVLAVFIAHQKRTVQPLIRLELFTHPAFARGAIVAFVYGSALFARRTCCRCSLQMALALPPSQAGAVLLPAGIVLRVVIPLVGRAATPANRWIYVVVASRCCRRPSLP